MKKIAILNGWISTEREVSLRSGANMREWCIIAGYETDIYNIPESIDIFLSKYQEYDLIIPMLHGRYGEDGVVTGMCETLWVRVAWCSAWVHALCIDKFHTNCVVEKLGIKVPKSWLPGLPKPAKLIPESTTWETDEALEIKLIVKPNQWWSSLATAKVTTSKEFYEAIENIDIVIKSLTEERIKLLSWKNNKDFIRHFPPLTDLPLIQECIEWREFTVGIYRNESGHHALPIMEACNVSGLHGYEEKYESDGSNEVFSDLNLALQKDLEEQSIRICQFLGTKWVVRIDWRYDGHDLYFLEVNTIPGFTSASFIPKMWKQAGKSEKEFIEMLIF